MRQRRKGLDLMGRLCVGMGSSDKLRNHFMYHRWYSMLYRCYSKNSKDYNSYGNKGVSVCERWFSLSNFIKDVALLNGYDEKLVRNGLLELDKDKLSTSLKIYSPETCCWISNNENNLLMRDTIQTSMKGFIGHRLSDGYKESSMNQSEFSKKWNLSRSKIGEVLSGKYKKHKGWTFYYE